MFAQPQRLNGCNLAAPPTQHEYYGGRRIILHERCSCDCLTRSSFGFHCCSVYCKVLLCSWLNSYWHLNHSIAPSASAMDVTLQSHACLLQQREWELRWVDSQHTWKLASYRTFLRITCIHVTEHPALQPICVLGTRNAGVAGLMWFSSWELQLFPRRNTLSLNIQNWHLSFFNVIHSW